MSFRQNLNFTVILLSSCCV